MEKEKDVRKPLSEERAKLLKEAAELTPEFKKNSRRDAICLDLPRHFPSTNLYS